MRIRVSDSEANGGLTTPFEVKDGFTVADYFAKRKGGASPSGYRIRVNGTEASSATMLRDGDFLVLAPDKKLAAA